MKALRSAHHTDPDVEEEEEEGVFGGGGGGGGRMRSGWRARRARCPVSSPELRAKQKMPPKSILLICLLFIYFNPPLPTEIRLIPPEEGLAHRFCVSGSAPRGEDRESWGGGGAASCSRTRQQCGTWTAVCCVVDFAKPAQAVRFEGWRLDGGDAGVENENTANVCRAPEPSASE